MKFLCGFIVMLLSFSAVAAFNDCNCPQVTCEPCQIQIFLGKEAKSCGVGATIQCEKIVCENVDNYFQCVAGEKPMSYPPQNRTMPLTEPKLSNIDRNDLPSLPAINFDKIGASQDWEVEESAPLMGQDPQMTPVFARKIIESSVEKSVNPEDYLHLRRPASVGAPKNLLKVVKVSGDVRVSGKERIKKNQSILLGHFIKAKSASRLELLFGASSFEVQLKKDSELIFDQQDQYLVFNLMKGQLSFHGEESLDSPMMVFDLGSWRMGKRSGRLQWSRDRQGQTLQNISQLSWIRRDDLMEKPIAVEAGRSFQIDAQNVVASFKEIQEKAPVAEDYKLQVSPGKTQPRGLASESPSFCQAPQAQYEQCAWKCFGNGKKACDTNKKNVRCVRFTCAAGGEWKLPTFYPGSACESQDVRIGLCQ